MRLPRPRFTVRRLMAAVAVVGLMLGSSTWLGRRAASFREAAISHRAQAQHAGGSLSPITGKLWGRYNEAMADKYEQAARHPWLPVAPDPPEPQ
jgi:hypothetical protein